MTVYVVAIGDYSDYHVVGICSTRKKASTLAENIGGDNDCVSAWEVDRFLSAIETGRRPYSCSYSDEYTCADGHIVPAKWIVELSESALDCVIPRWRKFSLADGKNRSLGVSCHAKDEDHALKIMFDTLAIVKAEGWWDRPGEFTSDRLHEVKAD